MPPVPRQGLRSGLSRRRVLRAEAAPDTRPSGVSEADQVEELVPLQLPEDEYIPYAYAAIETLRGRLETG